MTDQRTATKAVTAPVLGHRWRNLYFTRSGRTYWSCLVQNTEAESAAASKGYFEEVAEYLRDGGDPHDLVETGCGAHVAIGQLTFAVPMPWKG